MDSNNENIQNSTKLVPLNQENEDNRDEYNDNVLLETNDDEKRRMLPDYKIADLVHQLRFVDEVEEFNEEKIKSKLLQRVLEDEMLPFYTHLCETFSWIEDEEIVEKLKNANEIELKKLEDKIADATENYGDSEVREALLNKANFYCRIGNKKAADAEYQIAFDKTIGSGSRLDIILTLIRTGFFYGDFDFIKKNITKAKEELEKGGDWERRNKLRVYEGIYFILVRRFQDAANLLLDGISTFTATELMSFEQFIFYVSIVSMLSLDRPSLKKKIIHSPEVLQVVAEDEDMRNFIFSFYNCKYKLFMESLLAIAMRIKRDRYFGKHYFYFIRNIRLRAYAQFLEPFRSVTIAGMANAFGVSESCIDKELSSFIASGKLHCKIDKINQIIDSNYPDSRDSLYQKIIKEGDLLLNRTQKLSRFIDV